MSKLIMSRKIFTVALVLVMSVSLLAACGGGTDASDEPVARTPAADDGGTVADDGSDGQDAAPDPSDAGDGLRVVIITSPNSINDGAFNENCYGGVLAFLEKHPGATATAVQEEQSDNNRPILAVEENVADYDAIITPSSSFAAIARIAEDYPDKYFILLDVFPRDDEGNTVEVDNIYAVQFKEQDRGFIAGVAAALETKTGKVATIGGMASVPPNVNDQFGFEAGVHYANAHLGAEVELLSIPAYAGTDVNGNNIGGNYVGSFGDADLGKLLAGALYDAGADIIFTFAGGSSNGVFAAALERDDVYVIGAGVDQYDLGTADGKSVVLTSVIKLAGVNVERALNAISDGTFEGGNMLLGIETGSVGYVSAPGRHQLSAATLPVLENVLALIVDGVIVPPHNFSDSTPTDFPGL